MQSSGVGNTINLLGLTKTLRFPFLTLITMRGDYGEFNSWQYPMGQGTPKVLEAMGVLSHGNVRVSLHAGVTESDVDRFLAVLPGVVAELRAQAGVVGL